MTVDYVSQTLACHLLYTRLARPAWLIATDWYIDNLPSLGDKVRSFENDGVIVSRAKDAVENQELTSQLTSIQCYRSLVRA